MLDSTAKFPDGALDFHIQLLGNMEECIDIDVPSQVVGDETLPGFTGKYLYSKFGSKKSNGNERIVVVIPNIGDSIAMAAQVWFIMINLYDNFNQCKCYLLTFCRVLVLESSCNLECVCPAHVLREKKSC